MVGPALTRQTNCSSLIDPPILILRIFRLAASQRRVTVSGVMGILSAITRMVTLSRAIAEPRPNRDSAVITCLVASLER